MFVFFFQAEDGIRDKLVTGVQTCALPIYAPDGAPARPAAASGERPGISLPNPVEENERRRLFLDQTLELTAELLHRHVGGRGKARQLVRVLEIVAPQPDHVAARDGVARRRDVHPPRARPARYRIDHRREGDGDELPRLPPTDGR